MVSAFQQVQQDLLEGSARQVARAIFESIRQVRDRLALSVLLASAQGGTYLFNLYLGGYGGFAA